MVFWSLVFLTSLQLKRNMMKRNMKHLLLASLLGFVSLAAYAVPAKKGVWRMVTLTDGTQKRVELRGDEFCSYWVDAEGANDMSK